MQERLLFLIGSPRSGSTLLARMLGAHSAVDAPAEPHLMTPLAHLGYYDRVDTAPYDPVIAQRAIRELVASLPAAESDYLEALRAYSDRLYTHLLGVGEGSFLVDKTPAYALVLDFIARLYPNARYIVLTRHPLAIWSSYVESFFDGDHRAAHSHNPLLERYVPAIARFLRERPVPIAPIRYEDLVQEPKSEIGRLCEFIGVGFEPAMVDYGERAPVQTAARGLGDPMTVAREKRPITASLSKWARNLSGRPDAIAQCLEILERLADEDLETWGYSRQRIHEQLAEIDSDGPKPPRPRLSRHTLERKLLVLLRRNIHRNRLGALVRRLREVCDVLLR